MKFLKSCELNPIYLSFEKKMKKYMGQLATWSVFVVLLLTHRWHPYRTIGFEQNRYLSLKSSYYEGN